MTISRITLGKTINIGNYQSIRVEFTADVDPSESHIQVLDHLKRILDNAEADVKRDQKAK